MMTLSKETILDLDKIGAQAKFFMVPGDPPLWTAEIVDITTKTAYATGTGIDRELAVIDAIANARSAPKPLTKAQKEGVAHADAITAKLQAENDKLRAELEAARSAAPARTTRKTSLSTAE